MVLFDTYRLLHRYRQNGFLTRRTRDSSGQTIWEVVGRMRGQHVNGYPLWRYVGIVVCTYPQPMELGGLVLCFGKPWFYRAADEELKTSSLGTQAWKIADRFRRGSARDQLPPEVPGRV